MTILYAPVTTPVSLLRSYETFFPLTENPISEGSNWINGLAVGLDWQDVRTTTNKAFGVGVSTVNYDDPIASLTGTWGANQSVEATIVNTNPTNGTTRELELRLHTSIAAHSSTGYECNLNTQNGNCYMQIVRWEGGSGVFTVLTPTVVNPPPSAVVTGDIFKATVVANAISVYLNGLLMLTVTDSVYPTGAPGIGFFGRTPAAMSEFGFSHLLAKEL